MNVVSRGVRNAFRNTTRTISIILILGLSIGLSMVMLIANQAVESKIKTTLSSIGNTIRIHPAGTSSGGITTTLTNNQLDKLKKLKNITSVSGMLSGSLQTKGTTSMPITPDGGDSQTQKATPTGDNGAPTTLKTPFKLDCKKGSCTSGSTGLSNAGGEAPKLPANYSLPIPVVGANTSTDPAVIGASSLKIIEGVALDGNKDNNDAMVSKEMATKNNLHVGSTFKAYDKMLRVAAVFDSNTRTGDSTIVISLPAMQRLAKQKNLITSAVATVDSLENLSSATSAIQAALGDSVDVNSPLEEANMAIAPLKSVKSISLYSLIGAVIAGGVIILLTMVMIVRERKREIGVFKAIGFSNARIMFQFMNEALTLTLLAAAVGLIIGIVGGDPVTSTLINNSGTDKGIGFEGALGNVRDVQAVIGWETILYGLGAALFIAVAGSALASFFIAKVRPAEVLRSE